MKNPADHSTRVRTGREEQTRDYATRPAKRRRRTNAELEAIDQAIIEVAEAEHPISLRGVYYRVVSRGAIEKTDAAYNVVQRQLLKLRRAGRVPYEYVVDGSRSLQGILAWSSIEERLRSVVHNYRRSIWDNQNHEILVLIEKDAIDGVVEPVTDKWQVQLGSTRGYSSETFKHTVAGVVRRNTHRGKRTVLFNLGDHDPSGADAWRDFEAKIRGFVPDADADFTRLAVLEEQIQEWGLLTRPTKMTDTRASGFVGGSVEVDAIESSQLRSLLEEAIVSYIDQDRLEETRRLEADEQVRLRSIMGGAL